MTEHDDRSNQKSALNRPLTISPNGFKAQSYSVTVNNFVAGTQAMRSGNLPQAEACFRAAIADAPQFFGALINLGNVLYSLKRFEEALQYYRAAVHVEPQNAAGHYNLANTLTKLELFEQAIEAFQRALILEPEHVPTKSNLEYLRTKMGLKHAYAFYDPGQEHPENLYYKNLFEVRSEKQARSVILTKEQGISTQQRWETETPYLVKLLVESLQPTSTSVVLDFGCGIGRIAKRLIEQTSCSVLGVDISKSMRRFAIPYVERQRFSVMAPEMLDLLNTRLPIADAAYSIWVLQHCLDPKAEIARINAALKPGGTVFILNTKSRCLPTKRGWINDKQDVRALLEATFECTSEIALNTEGLTNGMVAASFCGTFRKR